MSRAQATDSQPLTLTQYIGELDRYSRLLEMTPIDVDQVRASRASLPSHWKVQSGGSEFSIGTDWLSGDLAEIEKNPGANTPALDRARESLRLRRMDVQSLADSVQQQASVAESRKQMDAILSSKEFRGDAGPGWFDQLKQRIYDWIGRKLEKIFGPIRRTHLGNAIAWIAISIAGALLLFWTVRFLMRGGQTTGMDLSGAVPPGRDWRRWLREAREAAARGDFRAAIHAAYWTAIVRMEETNSLPEDRSRTPRESLRLIGRDNSAYAPLAQLTRRFELVWYGYRAATVADWDDASQQLEILGCPRS